MPRTKVPRLVSRRREAVPRALTPAPEKAVAEGVAGVGTGLRKIGSTLMKEEEARAKEARAERERLARKLEREAEKEEAKRQAAQEKFKKAQEAAWGTKVMTTYSRLLHEESLKQQSTPAGYTNRMQEFGEGAIEELLSNAPSGEAQLVVRGRLQKHLADNLNRGSTWEYGELFKEQEAGQEERLAEAEKAAYLGQDRYEVWAELRPDVEAFNVTYAPGARGRERNAEAQRRVNWSSAMGRLERNPRRLKAELEAGAWNAELPAEDLQKLSAKLGPEIQRQEGEEYQSLLRDIYLQTKEMEPEDAIKWVQTARFSPPVKNSDRRMMVNSIRADLAQQRQDEQRAQAQAQEETERGILQKMAAGTGTIDDVMRSDLPAKRKEHWIKAFEARAKDEDKSDPTLANETLIRAYDRDITKTELLNLVGQKPGLSGPDAEHRLQILEKPDPAKAPYMKRALSILEAEGKGDGVYAGHPFELARAINTFEQTVAASDAKRQEILNIAEDILAPKKESFVDKYLGNFLNALPTWLYSREEEKRAEEEAGARAAKGRAAPENEEAALRRRAVEILRLNKKLVNEETIKLVMDQLRKAR